MTHINCLKVDGMSHNDVSVAFKNAFANDGRILLAVVKHCATPVKSIPQQYVGVTSTNSTPLKQGNNYNIL